MNTIIVTSEQAANVLPRVRPVSSSRTRSGRRKRMSERNRSWSWSVKWKFWKRTGNCIDVRFWPLRLSWWWTREPIDFPADRSHMIRKAIEADEECGGFCSAGDPTTFREAEAND